VSSKPARITLAPGATAELEFDHQSRADQAVLVPGVVRTGERSIAWIPTTGHDFIRTFRAVMKVADVQMSPGHGDDGLRAALEVRRRSPETGVLILSQYYEEDYALELIGDRPEGVGYLLKERVGDVDAFIQSVTRVAAGGSALDPEVVGRMLGRRRGGGPLEQLSPRERDVLAAMAEGKSNQGIAEALVVTEAAVEKHVTRIFQKLGLGPNATEHRRVRAVLAYLQDPPRSRST